MIAVEEQVFSLGTPQAFFSMFGTLGGQISADFAMEAFYDDMSVTGRQVRLSMLALTGDYQRPRDAQREAVYSILPTLASCPVGSAVLLGRAVIPLTPSTAGQDTQQHAVEVGHGGIQSLY